MFYIYIYTLSLSSRQWWMPDTGGANIPALNELLAPLGMAFRYATIFSGMGYALIKKVVKWELLYMYM